MSLWQSLRDHAERAKARDMRGLFDGTDRAAAYSVRQGGLLFSVGLKIALPVVCVVLLVNVGLATIARTVPQVNIFVIGFLVTISLGMLVLGFAIPATASVFETVIEDAIRGSIRITKMF